MPPYTSMRWEKALEGWDLFAVDEDSRHLPALSLLGWVYENHAKGTWFAVAYSQVDGRDLMREFDDLEDAQAWVVACVRMT